MSDTLDKVYESLASRTDLTSFDRRIYELLLAFHRLPLPNYNMPPLSMLAFRSNQTEKAVMQCLFRLRDAGLVRVLTDRSGIFPSYYRVIENPVLPAPAEPVQQPEPEPEPEPEPVQVGPIAAPIPSETTACQTYWVVVPCAVCTITFTHDSGNVKVPEANDTPPELELAETNTNTPGIKSQSDTQAKQRTAKTKLCRAAKIRLVTSIIHPVSITHPATTIWQGLFVPR